MQKQIKEANQNSDQSNSDNEQTLHHQSAQPQLYMLDPHEYLLFCQKDKKIKIMDQCNPILNNVYLKDISLHKKGPLQDKIYSKNNMYYCNIRRGNTLCQIYDEQQKQKQLFMCRRGMKKFYDLQPEYLKVNRKLTHQHQRYRNRIFEKLDKILAENEQYKIHLYGLFKQNGQHCQISYIKQIDYWLFASKNVAILAKTQQDLQKHYEKQRFYWAKLIGQEFFKTINNFTVEQKQQFIKDIDGKTLLGEHCGYDKHQHITKYEKIQIIFYGLVQNNGIDHCLPVSVCENFLKKYGLKMSKTQKIEGLRQKNKIYFSMYKMLKKIAQGTMDQCGEGSVMYIVAEDNQGNQKMVGMCKLKTCQYLIYRRMRQMIKIYFAKKGATANTFEKFKFEIQSLCEHYFKPPKPLQFYYKVAEEAFNQVRKNGKDFTDDQFRYKFVNFLQNVQRRAKLKKQQQVDQPNKKQQICRIILITPPLLSEQYIIIQKLCKKLSITIQFNYRQIPNQKLNKSIIHILHMVPRLNFEQLEPNTIFITYEITKQHTQKIVNQLSQKPDIKKSHLITFIKSEDKIKSIQLLKQKIDAFQNSFDQKVKNKNKQELPFLRIAKNIQQIICFISSKRQYNNINQQTKREQQQHLMKRKNKIFVIITLLIPGSGKSSLAETITNEFPDFNMQVISSDKIRQTIIQKYKAKRKGDEVEMEQAYAATKKKGLQKYREAINGALGQGPPSEDKIIYIDRVFCPTTVFENIQQINKPWTKFIIVTQTQIPTKLNDYIYPHSLNYLLGCIKRSLEREQHQTLSSKPNQIVRVIMKFFQMYRGFTYNKLSRQLQEQNIDFQIMQLQFLKEGEEADNLFLKKKVEQCLKGISPGHDAPESDLYTELIQLIYKYIEHIERKKSEETALEKEELLRLNAQKLLKTCK